MQYAATKVIGINATIVLAVNLTEVDQTCVKSTGCIDDIIRLQPEQNKTRTVHIIPYTKYKSHHA